MLRRLFNRRRFERRSCDIGTTVREGDGPDFPVRLISLSDRGFRLKGSDAFREESRLSIDLPGYRRVVGRVVWTNEDECGGIFLTPIVMDQVRFAEITV